MLRILLTITVLSTAIAFAAGCGNASTSSSDAASLAPAGSLVYGEATLRPEGDQNGQLMEKAFAESDSGLSYKDDVEPWLGDEAAFFVSNIPAGGKDPDAAVLVATEDEEATVETVEKDGDVRKTEHGGHDLYV